jgi:uncharacterized repeat protein (TIGR04076 family)
MTKFKTKRMGQIHTQKGGENHQIMITVKDIRGPDPCPRGHIVGDSYVYPYDVTPQETGRGVPMCMATLAAIYPELRYMSLFGVFPPEWKTGDKLELVCADVKVGVVFELKFKR